MPARKKLLILGGTGEAAALARAAVDGFGGRLDVITSLAGRTRAPRRLAGEVRVGGFGGAAGLADHLAREAVGMVIDATHPFAATISDHAAAACRAAGVPRLALVRPRWRRTARDQWVEVDDVAAAAAELARRGGRAFITVGVKELDAFAGLDGVFRLVRLVEPPRRPPPLANCEIVVARGPFSVAGEEALLRARRIDLVVSKASGGRATRAKITAARRLGLPVIMVRRPPDPPAPRARTVAAALDWIERGLFDRPC